MASLAHDFANVFSSKIVLLVTGLASNSFLAWTLAPEGLGSYYVCVVFSSLLMVFFTLGCDVACVYYVATRKYTLSQGVVYAFIYSIAGSIIAIAVGLYLIELELAFFLKAPPLAFKIALANIPISFLSLVLISLLTAIKDFKAYAQLSVLFSIVQLIIVVIFVWYFSMGVEGVLLAMNLSGLISIIGTLAYFKIKYQVEYTHPRKAELVEIINYGTRYYFGKVSNILNSRISTSMLAFIADTRDIGMFTLAAQLTERIEMLPDALSTILISRVAGNTKGHVDVVAMCARITMVCCTIALVLLAAFSHLIVYYVFSPKFLPAVLLIQIMCIGVAFRCTSKIFVPYLLGKNKPGIASVAVLFGMIVNGTFLWFGYSEFGLTAAAFGMVLGYLVSATVLVSGFVQTSNLTFIEVFHFRKSDWLPIIHWSQSKIGNMSGKK